MRIVAGRWRGRQIAVPPGNAIRPTLDRVREAWMNIVQMDLPGARVIDLFAGSGALGLEAVSRGAVSVDFVENDRKSIAVLEGNIASLKAEEFARIHRRPALAFVEEIRTLDYDVAFADPPYATGGAAGLARRWLDVPFSRVLGIEHAATEKLPGACDTRRYGSSAITFYRSED